MVTEAGSYTLSCPCSIQNVSSAPVLNMFVEGANLELNYNDYML